ncbi:hypothetical protein [Candidatus Protochlamydia phocaeensis]|uniref:hypothetical protein n=1 Tax=Candidatus Protochlamydia phocaeensis TaxID=1414722 RepID=UPI000ADE4D87|nr:hypothetical protein [Candidatus Protochlamydia phocaeensis]
MKDITHHIRHVQKKVIRSNRQATMQNHKSRPSNSLPSSGVILSENTRSFRYQATR